VTNDQASVGLSPELLAQIRAERSWWWMPRPRLNLAIGLVMIVAALLSITTTSGGHPAFSVIQVILGTGFVVSAVLTLRSKRRIAQEFATRTDGSGRSG